jgi:hypothetical protein
MLFAIWERLGGIELRGIDLPGIDRWLETNAPQGLARANVCRGCSAPGFRQLRLGDKELDGRGGRGKDFARNSWFKVVVRDSSPTFHQFDQGKTLTSSIEPAQDFHVFVFRIFFAIELGGSCTIEPSAPCAWQLFLAISSLKRGSRDAQETWTQVILALSLQFSKP